MCVAFSCATVQKEGSVKPEINNIYLSSVTIKSNIGRTFGSGTIIYNRVGQQMFVLTAAHVVKAILERDQKPYVSTAYDIENYETTIYKIDYERDLALLSSVKKMKKPGPFVKISLHIPNIGDSIWVIGTPLGDDRTVTNGIISNFKVDGKKMLYRTTAPVYYGNSGGGMFNSNNELIGVAHAILQVQLGVFIVQNVPGGAFFVGLETIRKFM